jgi:hypothetical protein
MPGVELYTRHQELWYRHGHHLPTFGLPASAEMQRLDHVLTPVPVQPEFAAPLTFQPQLARLVRDDRPRAAVALLCRLTELAAWADQATSAHLASLQGALAGQSVMVLGHRLPPLAGGERFWGRFLLAPLGYRMEPALPERELLQAFGVSEAELLVVREGGAELIPQDAFLPLTRAGVRLALGGRP